jgi:hypothetical protein
MRLSPGPDGKKEAHAIYRALREICQLLAKHDMLPDPMEAELKALCDQMTDILCPYPVSRLDQRLKELDDKFPDFEHGYVRSGTTITWVDE